jgi:hypothetical protein
VGGCTRVLLSVTFGVRACLNLLELYTCMNVCMRALQCVYEGVVYERVYEGVASKYLQLKVPPNNLCVCVNAL